MTLPPCVGSVLSGRKWSSSKRRSASGPVSLLNSEPAHHFFTYPRAETGPRPGEVPGGSTVRPRPAIRAPIGSGAVFTACPPPCPRAAHETPRCRAPPRPSWHRTTLPRQLSSRARRTPCIDLSHSVSFVGWLHCVCSATTTLAAGNTFGRSGFLHAVTMARYVIKYARKKRSSFVQK